MAANTLTRVGGFSYNTNVTATEFTKLDTNGAQSVNRNSTMSGTRALCLYPAATRTTSGGGVDICSVTIAGITCVNVAHDLYVDLTKAIDSLDKHVLNTCAAFVLPAAGAAHGAGAPGVLPSIHIYKVARATGNATLLASSTPYVWAGQAAYELGFTLTTADAAHTIDLENYTYVLKIILESGANSVSGCIFERGAIACTVDNTNGGPDYTHWT